MKRLTGKQLTILGVSLAVILLVGGGYLFYAKVFGNAAKIKLYETAVPGYEWQDIAADNNIVSDYLWSRTKKLMIPEGSVLIPSSYMIEGRLVTQEAEVSEIYDLSDQALLLKCYVRSGDRLAAASLKNEVIKQFKTYTGLYLSTVGADVDYSVISDNVEWLDAFLEYYSLYGTADDYEEIKQLTDALFDDNGELIPESLTIAKYVDTMYVSTDDHGDGEGEDSSLEQIYGAFVGEESLEQVDRDDPETEITGVKISDIDLKLIYNLEQNGLIAGGSYDKALSTVKDSLCGGGIPYYAYAYQNTDSGVNYIYSGTENAAISMTETIKTMKNLAEMNELDAASYNELRNLIMNTGFIYMYYYITTGNYSENIAYDAYVDAMQIAFLKGDTDLYGTICNRIGMRVATKSTSSALYMVFREEDGRYVFYASDNLGVRLAVG